MKKRFLNLFVALLLGAVWLFPFEGSAHEWILTAGFAASFMCICLIPQRYMAFASAVFITAGMCFYDASFFAAFAPAVFFSATVYSAFSKKSPLAVKKDGFLCLMLALDAVSVIGSLCYTLISVRQIGFEISSFERQHIYILIAFGFTAFLLYKAFIKQKKSAENSKNTKKHIYERLVIIYAVQLLCMAAAALFCLKHSAFIRTYTLSVFICVYSSLTSQKGLLPFFEGSKENL